jgi:hypothetical protein
VVFVNRDESGDKNNGILEINEHSNLVQLSIQSDKGQGFLKDLALALEEMPEKRLITNALKCKFGFCALGVLGEKRGIDLDELDPGNSKLVAKIFAVDEPMVKEIAYRNDDHFGHLTPETRWAAMRDWVQSNIKF